MATIVAHLSDSEHALSGAAGLVEALRRAYPYMQFRADVERERVIYATGGDPHTHEIVRAFCAGYLARRQS